MSCNVSMAAHTCRHHLATATDTPLRRPSEAKDLEALMCCPANTGPSFSASSAARKAPCELSCASDASNPSSASSAALEAPVSPYTPAPAAPNKSCRSMLTSAVAADAPSASTASASPSARKLPAPRSSVSAAAASAAPPGPRSECSSTPVATDTFKESSSDKSTSGPGATLISCVHARLTMVRNPAPSLPTTRIVGCAAAALAGAAFGPESAPTTAQPALAACVSVSARFRVLYTGACSSVPAEALEATGVSGAQFLALAMTPATPKKYAERMMAPRFCCTHKGSIKLLLAAHSTCNSAACARPTV